MIGVKGAPIAGRFVFVRHAESEKNLVETTGGPGGPLTSRGIAQVSSFCDRLSLGLSSEARSPRVVSSPSMQALATADLVAAHLGLRASVVPALTQAGMGVTTGLTESEIAAAYPDVSSRIRLWRERRIEACDLRIPGMEDPALFWDRTLAAIRGLTDGRIVIVFTTRSIMVLAANLALGNRPEPGGGYMHVTIGYCDSICIDYVSDDGRSPARPGPSSFTSTAMPRGGT